MYLWHFLTDCNHGEILRSKLHVAKKFSVGPTAAIDTMRRNGDFLADRTNCRAYATLLRMSSVCQL